MIVSFCRPTVGRGRKEEMKLAKKSDERRNQILDVAQELFLSKGFHKTTINDILKIVDIAKGTFYYYYESKMDVLDDLIDRFIDRQVEELQKLSVSPELTALEKFAYIISNPHNHSEEKEKILEELHKIDNAEMHQRSLVESVLKITPIVTRIVEQGIEEKIFTTPYPQETVEILIISFQILFDDGLFTWSYEERISKLKAMAWTFDLLLGAKEGSFNFIYKGEQDKVIEKNEL